MNNDDNPPLFIQNPTIINALSEEIRTQANTVYEDALSGRTTIGTGREIRIHSILDFLGIFPKNSDPIDIGASTQNHVNYDYNADWFEHPLKNLGNIIDYLFGG